MYVMICLMLKLFPVPVRKTFKASLIVISLFFSSKSLNIQWTGYAKKTAVVLFNSECVINKRMNLRTVGGMCTFRTLGNKSLIVYNTLQESIVS